MDRARTKRLFWMSDKLMILWQELEKWPNFLDWMGVEGTELDTGCPEKLGAREFRELREAYDDAASTMAALGNMFIKRRCPVAPPVSPAAFPPGWGDGLKSSVKRKLSKAVAFRFLPTKSPEWLFWELTR